MTEVKGVTEVQVWLQRDVIMNPLLFSLLPKP